MRSLPFRFYRRSVNRLAAALIIAAAAVIGVSGTADASHGGGDWHGGHEWHYRHGGWVRGHWYGGPGFFPPLRAFGLGVYPGYYAAPYPYYYPYAPAPPVYAPAPPVSFGFVFGR